MWRRSKKVDAKNEEYEISLPHESEALYFFKRYFVWSNKILHIYLKESQKSQKTITPLLVSRQTATVSFQ